MGLQTIGQYRLNVLPVNFSRAPKELGILETDAAAEATTSIGRGISVKAETNSATEAILPKVVRERSLDSINAASRTEAEADLLRYKLLHCEGYASSTTAAWLHFGDAIISADCSAKSVTSCNVSMETYMGDYADGLHSTVDSLSSLVYYTYNNGGLNTTISTSDIPVNSLPINTTGTTSSTLKVIDTESTLGSISISSTSKI